MPLHGAFVTWGLPCFTQVGRLAGTSGRGEP